MNRDEIVADVINLLRYGPPKVQETRDINSTYFVIPVDEAGSWLETIKDVEFDETTSETLALLYNDITSESKLALYFTLPDRVTTVNSVLSLVYDAVLKTMQAQALADGSLVVCLGLDNDPYSIEGPLLYFYLQVPNANLDDLKDVDGNFPPAWEQLPGPREKSMLWAAECYDPKADTATTTN